MFNWVIDNREWIFSGIGIALATGIITFLWSLFKKKSASSKNEGITLKQKGGRGSINVQIGGVTVASDKPNTKAGDSSDA